jgi:hypothetical protein
MTDVHTRQEMEGDHRGGMALEHQREAASHAMQARPGFDIAAIDDEEFGKGLEKIKLRQVRLQQILATVMIENVHYGNPKDRNGRPVFKTPMLYQAGAEELRTFFRLTLKHVEAPIIVSTKEYASVTVTLGIYDSAGRLLGQRSGNCNTMEKRFARNDGKGFIYADAREMEHNCLAMAEKRAGTLITREATGSTGFFAAEEEMDKALASEPAEPWSELDKKMVYARANKVGIRSADEFAKFARETLGREDVSFIGSADVKPLLEAIDTKRKPSPPMPADRTSDDDELDRKLAGQ